MGRALYGDIYIFKFWNFLDVSIEKRLFRYLLKEIKFFFSCGLTSTILSAGWMKVRIKIRKKDFKIEAKFDHDR